MLAFLTFNQEREQYLCAAVLRSGNVPTTRGTVGVLCRLLPLLRQAFPQARFLVRLGGGFATPEVLDFLDAEPRLDYVVAMATNAVLQRHAEPDLLLAQAQSAASGRTAHVYTDTRYRAGTWDRARRVVIKAEVVRLGDRAPRDNPRFVVTNLRQTPRFIYEEVYCARGDIENRIKELLDGLQIDRTSCCRFRANQLRVLLTAAAYVLLQKLRRRAARTGCARAQVRWLRSQLLKLGAHVVGSIRRVVLHLPTATPDLHAWLSTVIQNSATCGHLKFPHPWLITTMRRVPVGAVGRPSAPTISVHPAGARRTRRPAGRVRDDHTVRGADLEPSGTMRVKCRCRFRSHSTDARF